MDALAPCLRSFGARPARLRAACSRRPLVRTYAYQQRRLLTCGAGRLSPSQRSRSRSGSRSATARASAIRAPLGRRPRRPHRDRQGLPLRTRCLRDCLRLLARPVDVSRRSADATSARPRWVGTGCISTAGGARTALVLAAGSSTLTVYVLGAERVAHRAARAAAARDREDHVGLVAARVHHLGERARAVAELLPAQLLARRSRGVSHGSRRLRGVPGAHALAQHRPHVREAPAREQRGGQRRAHAGVAHDRRGPLGVELLRSASASSR